MDQEYSEYQIEYDLNNNTVYVSGLDEDGFWIEFQVQTDVAEPESYAWGYADALGGRGRRVEVENVTE